MFSCNVEDRTTKVGKLKVEDLKLMLNTRISEVFPKKRWFMAAVRVASCTICLMAATVA